MNMVVVAPGGSVSYLKFLVTRIWLKRSVGPSDRQSVPLLEIPANNCIIAPDLHHKTDVMYTALSLNRSPGFDACSVRATFAASAAAPPPPPPKTKARRSFLPPWKPRFLGKQLFPDYFHWVCKVQRNLYLSSGLFWCYVGRFLMK